MAVAILACSKENSTTNLRVRMTDAPAAWEEVNVDLEEIRVKMANDSTSWITLQTNAGIYNLLDLQNGVDTLIAQGDIPSGRVKEIRLILADSNSIKVNGQLYDLTIPSGAESGLKIKIDKDLDEEIETLLIDFDAALSIKEQNGSYKLMPVIKLK